MSKYIDREAFKNKYLCCGYLPEMSEEEFDKFPAADVVEVVLCRDCKYSAYNNKNEMYCYHCFGLEYIEPDYFCSYGKRR